MYKSTIQRRYVTLIEMMIVMFLIALITGVIAYNYRGSLDEGKAFKTEAAISKLETILNLEVAKNPSKAGEVASHWREYVQASPIVHDPQALLKDGWGEDFQVVSDENGAIHVFSPKFRQYQETHNSLFNKDES